MAASYPTSVKTFTTKTTGEVIEADYVNDLQLEVTAIETQLLAGLPANQGGTGKTSYTTGDMLAASSSTALTVIPAVATGQVLASAGTGTVPAYTATPSVTSLALKGATSGSVTVAVPAVAGSNTVTLPAGTTNFSATGGTSQVVKQTTAGGALTVAQLAASDLSNGVTGTGSVVLDSGPTFSGDVNVAATKKVFLDGGGDTYAQETSANVVGVTTGGTERISLGPYVTSAVQPRCVAYHNTTQSINDSTWTTANFNSEDLDVGTMHDTVTNNSRVTIPTSGAGLYLVTAIIAFDANATGIRAARMIKNGVTATQLQQVGMANGGASNSVTGTLCCLLSLAAADYIEVQAYQNSGGALNIGSTARASSNTIQIVKLW